MSSIRLPKIISDGMVIQRRKSIHIWGWTNPGIEVQATIIDLISHGKADETGRFDLYLPARESGGPYVLRVSDADGNEAVVSDVMIGIVWFCTGQSNMELPITRVKDTYPELVNIEENNRIRTFKIVEDSDFKAPLKELNTGAWNHVSKATILDFSATGYFFAEYLQKLTGETVGFINASLGGSRISSWMSRQMLEGYDELLAQADKYADDNFRKEVAENNVVQATAWREALDKLDIGLTEDWKREDLDDSSWEKMDIPVMFKDTELSGMNGVIWFRKEFDLPDELAGKEARLFLGTLVDRDEVFVNGVKVGGIEYQYPPRKYDIPEGLTRKSDNHIVIRLCVEYGLGRITPGKEYKIFNEDSCVRLDGIWKYKVAATCDEIPPTDFINWKPTGLYNAMTAPCHNYPVDGVIWYQGESNTHEPWDYIDLSKRMINGYRKAWGEINLPYVFVQLPNFVIDAIDVDDPWPSFRLQQSELLDIPDVGMAVTIDVGEDNDLHPTVKQPIGERLALWAAHIKYGYGGEYTGPVPVGCETSEDKSMVTITFDHADGLKASDIGKGAEINDFKLLDAEGNEHEATAQIRDKTIILKSTDVPFEIKKVRYLVSYTYNGAIIYNGRNLPMGPFEIEV